MALRKMSSPLSAQQKLVNHRNVWRQKPLLRRLYQEYYRRIEKQLPARSEQVVELGGGSGGLKTYFPTALSTDLVYCNWLDVVVDAEAMPFVSGKIDAFVGIDVLHHIDRPIRFFQEAARCLRPGGRILLVDPYISPVSYVVLKLFHPEPVNFAQDFFGKEAQDGLSLKDPWDANMAMATVMFWRQKSSFLKMFPGLQIIHQERFDWIWPLSGGFSCPALIPESWGEWLCGISRWKAMNDYSAFHAFVAIEKTA